MKMNKNIFACAVFLTFFNTLAHDEQDTVQETTIVSYLNEQGETTHSVTAIVLSFEQAQNILNEEQLTTIVDLCMQHPDAYGYVATANEIVYYVTFPSVRAYLEKQTFTVASTEEISDASTTFELETQTTPAAREATEVALDDNSIEEFDTNEDTMSIETEESTSTLDEVAAKTETHVNLIETDNESSEFMVIDIIEETISIENKDADTIANEVIASPAQATTEELISTEPQDETMNLTEEIEAIIVEAIDLIAEMISIEKPKVHITPEEIHIAEEVAVIAVQAIAEQVIPTAAAVEAIIKVIQDIDSENTPANKVVTEEEDEEEEENTSVDTDKTMNTDEQIKAQTSDIQSDVINNHANQDTITVTIANDDEITTMTAIIVTPEQAAELLESILGKDEAAKITVENGMTFTEKELVKDDTKENDIDVLYIVKDPNSQDKVSMSVKISVDVNKADDTEIDTQN